MTRVAGALAILALLASTACGVDPEDAVDGPVLTSPPSDAEEGLGALIEGRLVLDGDCLLLEPEIGPRRHRPHGTRWQTAAEPHADRVRPSRVGRFVIAGLPGPKGPPGRPTRVAR